MKVKSMSKLVGGLVIILLTTLAFHGCASRSLPVNIASYTPGRILLLPPRDLVQNGALHPMGVGSGKIFQRYLRQNFINSPFVVMTTSSKAFGFTQIADKNSALAEAKKMNADYCLQVVLGEFLNASPMTFRADQASVESAIMYDITTGDAVWELVAPLSLQKTNIGNHLGLLSTHAQTIVKSILKNVK